MKTAALIVAAGRGTRANLPQAGPPKQYRLLAGAPVLRRTMAAFARHDAVQKVMVAIHPDDAALFADISQGLPGSLECVAGGAQRQDSVRNGLDALNRDAPDLVLIHDAARPFVSAALVSRVVAALDHCEACVPARAVTETLKQVREGAVTGTLSREGLALAQTPQGFRFAAIHKAHKRASAEGVSGLTDDAAIAEWAGMTVRLVEGESDNIKLTTAADFEQAEQMLAARQMLTAADVRTGHGFDVHAFAAGDHVMLCGVKVAHAQALSGHSDADVGLHALTDAILGALCDGDIGSHFPPSDAKWRGAPSHLFLRHAAKLVGEHGGSVAHVDVTLICEAPKIGPHRQAMRARIADILEIQVERVSVKATTTEGLGFTGRKEGIAAQATATIRLPWQPREEL